MTSPIHSENPMAPTDSSGTVRAITEKLLITVQDRRLWLVVGLLLVISAVAQAIGAKVIPLGGGLSITLLPMIWGLLIAGFVSGQPWRRLSLVSQEIATAIMGVAVLLLCARLSFTIGPNIGLVISAGPALLLQELGHLFGTLLLALPLAVLLRMGPATIGATFSIDREGSFAMVSERYGSDSPQYRGVLSMYVFGSVFGAIIVSVIASLTTSLGVFDPRALAMGSGVGSGSMMAAAAAAVVAGHADMKDQVLALAATSNLITGFLGLYVGVWIALPLADRFYKVLTRRSAAAPGDERPVPAQAGEAALAQPVQLSRWISMAALSVAGVIVATIVTGSFSIDSVLTYVVLCAMAAFGLWLADLTKGKLPAIVTVMTLGTVLTSPISPIATWLVTIAKSVDFLTAITVTLTIAGLSIGKDLPALRSIGWKIVPVGAVAIAATFVLSTIVAEFALGLWH
ncbi:DUF3100 domain-containing protein [Propionicimonas sp.]|uniref:DUF3100 domain-containing protein n=1 Tax=Propionicimonas sp. TaxID=1955623 RepID=UPI0039E46B78